MGGPSCLGYYRSIMLNFILCAGCLLVLWFSVTRFLLLNVDHPSVWLLVALVTACFVPFGWIAFDICDMRDPRWEYSSGVVESKRVDCGRHCSWRVVVLEGKQRWQRRSIEVGPETWDLVEEGSGVTLAYGYRSITGELLTIRVVP